MVTSFEADTSFHMSRQLKLLKDMHKYIYEMNII